ncbi:MAG TPA: TrbC/VirB2 family protein [Candidatus Paceibacterota bacterium]|jgi:hypothetical protein|nr:TrbC/VirB2 family protein [Candidatus Paceibacterota bacterium]HOY11114.1 TrbC/VirB2 family protein [Candidatus Paceibacterota bacterium]HPB60379.1 TrbC/VirB2 family protein [Candidatus Paceibacterota bacterium]HPI24652.1 TrbC/VirB2 family protein [Candidatus Paceibacterota bacterium]HPN89284.1 TrbC/VirB2 family protein [Candidatus Paceibacterota bacterium]
MKKNWEKIRLGLVFAVCLVLWLLPAIILAEGEDSEFHLVVCGTGAEGAMDCDFGELKDLVGKTFKYVLGYIILPVATVLLIWAGFKTILEAYQGKPATFWRQMLRNIIIGMALAIGAYALVKTFINLFFSDDAAFQSIIDSVFGNN